MLLEINDLGNVIASRTFLGSNKNYIYVRIGQPFIPAGYEGNFCCPYQIEGIGDRKIQYGSGVDSIQALYVAFINISTDLYTSPEAQSDGIFWEGSRDLGLPVAEAIKDLVPKAGRHDPW